MKPIVSYVPPYIWPFVVLKWYSNPNLIIKNNGFIIFSNFSCTLLNPNYFFRLSYNSSKALDMRNLREYFLTFHCSNIVLVISKKFQKFFSIAITTFSHRIQKIFGNKILLRSQKYCEFSGLQPPIYYKFF